MARYAYIKNGDAVSQLQRIMPTLDELTTSGPDAFIKDFISSIGEQTVMVFSQHRRNSSFDSGKVKGFVYAAGITPSSKLVLRPIAWVRIFYKLMVFKPDRILCGSAGAILWLCFIVSRLLSVPIVHSRHNRVISDSDLWHRRLRSSFDKWCIVRMTAVVCHGPYLRKELLDIGVSPAKLFEFDVGFHDLLSKVGNSSASIPSIEGRRIILYIGRMERRKGIFDLFDATKERLRADKNLCLVYVGGGTDKSSLQSAVSSNALKQSVMLLGEIRHSDIATILSQSEIVVTPTQPSFPEGRCMVVMESLVLGVPVIAPDFGPFPFLIKHEINGLLYEPGSVSDLRKKLLSVLDDTELNTRLKQGAKKSGMQLLNPPLTFGQAVNKAFSLSDTISNDQSLGSSHQG